MDKFSRDLDRYITGNYGEDQFRNQCRICQDSEAKWLAAKGFHTVKVCSDCLLPLMRDEYSKFPLYPAGEEEG